MRRLGLLIVLLTLPLLVIFTPMVTLWNIHPITPVIVAAYLFGLHQVHRTRAKPMWFPRLTRQTVSDEPDMQPRGRSTTVWIEFICMAIVTGLAG